MKQKLRFLNFLFRSGMKIIIALFFFSAAIMAQESTPSEFVLGATWNWDYKYDPEFYNTFRESGMNFLSQYADGNTKDLLNGLNFMAYNSEFSNEWIYYYSTAYYSKWEAEEDQTKRFKVGVKHRERVGDILGNLIGSPATFLGRQCWSTEGLTSARDSLIYGPHYHQEKVYKRWYPDSLNYDRWDVRYTPRYIMALEVEDSTQLADTDTICRLYVVARYRLQQNNILIPPDIDYPLKEIILRASDFHPFGSFKSFYFGDISTAWYKYPEEFQDPHDGSNRRENPQTQGIHFFDRWGDQGVQFCVDWLRNDTKCNLYIDYIEVYDNDGWNRYIDNPQEVEDSIIAYAQRYPTSQWSNMKYWGGCDEPSSLDDYVPMKTVDAILDSIGAPRLITTFYPWWEVKVNEDTQLVRYYNTVRPEKLIIDFFPFLSWRDPATFDDWETTRKMLQICSTLQPNFYYQAQAAGTLVNGNWVTWRKPDTSEFKAQTMLALAHGVKGIVYWSYSSLGDVDNGTEGIIDANRNKTELWYTIHDNIAPRLKGTLGNTLLGLNYTGDYLELRRYVGPNTGESETKNYLTLSTTSQNPTPFTYYFHAGFFESPNQIDNNHFLLTNLITYDNRWVNVGVTDNGSNYINTRFRNVEPEYGFDTTFTDEFSIDILFLPGEGYLFQVAPVVKYGGKLIYPETISSTTTLQDEMIIKNGATLTVNAIYNAYADIRIKQGGRIITTGSGTIKFYQGHKLIIEGAAILAGTTSNKLKLDFVTPENSNGIIIKPGASLTISYCEINNAVKGITSELNLYNLNIQNVNFVDCDSVAIYITGRNRSIEELTLTPPPPQIKYCNITNSDFGILVSNLSQIVVQQNQITGTDYGIYLSNVTTPAVINNIIYGTSEMPGIFLASCNGIVRGNQISGCTNAIHLGNSSPDIGGNLIEHNWNRGLYVGSGSLPNMLGKLVQDPIHPNLFYAVSGYNYINENGGRTIEDDGSEIFINDANAILGDIKRYGCNVIKDQRIPNAEDTPPLYNTQLLMNCRGSGHPIEVHAGGNFWDEHPIYRLEERFGDCTVYLDPILNEPCPQPDGSDGKLFITSSTGEIIDTLYAEESTVGTLTETEQLYATAEAKFLTADFEGAELIYNQILGGNDSMEVKLDAYRRLYEAGKLLGKDETYFTGLRDTYSTLSSSTNDTLLAKIFGQLSSLSLVANEEYVPAIDEYDAIVQQNPNKEEAVYAEIDALTTALLVGDGDSTLQKGTLGKYLIKPGENYLSKLDGILRKHFGNGEIETEKELLPTEYTLYQNYPNPFNPVTTIKYDLPNASEVSLIIYDILGRRIKELVNEKQQAGRYEIQFNASNLASGVYIYQLMAEKYISSKKMILLK